MKMIAPSMIVTVILLKLLASSLLFAQIVGGGVPKALGTPSNTNSLSSSPGVVHRKRANGETKSNISSDQEVLSTRVTALEAGRQDLSAWATLLVGIISVVLAANVGLSVWQVSSLTQKEVDRLRSKYDKQFSGFLTRSQENLATRIADYQASVTDLAHAVQSLAPMLQNYTQETAAAAGRVRQEIDLSLERLRKEADTIRQAMQSR